jgi:hypothetical protein
VELLTGIDGISMRRMSCTGHHEVVTWLGQFVQHQRGSASGTSDPWSLDALDDTQQGDGGLPRLRWSPGDTQRDVGSMMSRASS